MLVIATRRRASLARAGLAMLLAVGLVACGGSSGGSGVSDRFATSVWPATTPVEGPPPLPAEFRPLLDLSAQALDALILQQFVDLTNPIAFGQTFAETKDQRVREFQLAAMIAQGNDGSRFGHPFHWYGHPDFNDQAAIVPVHFASANGEETLYGEILLPRRGAVPPRVGAFPVIVALEGLQGNIGMYRWWHVLFADAGYIVLAFDFTGQGMSTGSDDDTEATRVADTSRALDYLLQESPVRNFINTQQIGLIGHSMGAITTLEVQDRDPRFRAAIAAAPISEDSSDFAYSAIPIMLQTGDHDGPIAPIPFVNPQVVRPVYDKLESDKALIVAEAASHAQHTNYPIVPTPTWSREIAGIYSLAWMDYYLRGDVAALPLLRASHPHLSSLHGSEVLIGGQRTVLRTGTLDGG
jgi:pimeloyl-ACP methyl ester carboxylesterase